MNNTFRKVIKFTLIIIVIVLFTGVDVCAQNTDYKKNSIYVSYGNIIFSSQVSISYERMIIEKNKLRTKVKLNYGKYLSNNADYDTNAKVYENFLSISGVQLIGLFELNAGIAFAGYKLAEGFNPEPGIDYTEIKNEITPFVNVGIRYTKNKFLFRAGIGNLELLYLGIGVNF